MSCFAVRLMARSLATSGQPATLRASPMAQNQTTKRRLTNTTAGSMAPSKPAEQRIAGAAATRANRVHGAPATSVYDYTASDHLPALPVPKLEHTLERLRDTIWPMAMNSAEFAGALELIERVARSAAPKLDLLLRAKAAQTTNWLTHDWWLEQTYLKSRAPLVINSNPAMIYPPFNNTVASGQRHYINATAQLISSLVEFKLALQAGYNPEATSAAGDDFRLDPNLCYAQYRAIFGTTRVPGENRDKLVSAPQTSVGDQFHFVLSMRGKFYEICLGPQASQQEETRCDTLVNLLNKLLDHSAAASADQQTLDAAGLLTTSERSEWARMRPLLNADALSALERAQFLVCLDTVGECAQQQRRPQCQTGPTIADDSEQSFTHQLLSAHPGSAQHNEALLRQVLHGDQQNVANRWFDKSLQLIVVSDQQQERLIGAGINYEHSPAEGMVVAKLIEFSYDKLLAGQNRSASAQQAACSESSFKLLQFYKACSPVDGSSDVNMLSLEQDLRRARRNFAALVDQFDLAYFEHKAYGANAIKSWHFSPDSWFQVALQWAHYKLHKRLGPCYESASTRRFALGRTETIRSLTKHVAQFCFEPHYESLQAAVQSHKAYANEANNANAIDRVLMGYRLVYNELRAGSWRWGVPAANNGAEANKCGQETKQKPEKIKLEQLFTERELETLNAFFTNQLLERSKRFALSTSQVNSLHADICMSYGPYLADGYGCCYNITGQQIVAAITANSKMNSFSCEVDKLSESLHDSLASMRLLVESKQKKRK